MKKALLFLELLTDLFPPPEEAQHSLYFRDGRLRLIFYQGGFEHRIYFEDEDFDRPITHLVDNVIREVKRLPRCEDCGGLTRELDDKPVVFVCKDVDCGRLHTEEALRRQDA